LLALDDFGIEYLIVGGVALGFYVEPRYTKDLEVLVFDGPKNYKRLFAALKKFGAPLFNVRAEEFLAEDFVLFIGAPPWRVDILTSVPGVDFREAFAEREIVDLEGYKVSCISKKWLTRSKRASGRPQDLADLKRLEESPD